MSKFDNTEEFQLRQTGIDYNNKLNYYTKTDLHWNFYNSKQWIGIKTNGLSKWTFNICKSAINYFVAFIMSQKVKMQYSAENLPDEPTEQRDIDIKAFVKKLSNMAELKWEKDKMDIKLRQLMLDGAITGDLCAYVYWDPNKETGQLEKGDFCTEIVDGVNVMFGNPNNPNVEAQPYILINGRDMVANLKKEAQENGISQDLIDTITSDEDNQYQAGEQGKVELDNKNDTGKCNYIIKFWKKDGQVYWNKSTKSCPIRKDVAMGLKRYTIAWGNWESIKNSYHGMSAIEGIIDNQISINQLFAMVAYWMKMSAFGKVIYDKNRIASWSNSIGTAIKADGDIKDVVYQLQAGNFNSAVLEVINLAIKYTKDFIGANDALMGQVDPEQASGVAIITTTKQASIPLGNVSANRDQFVEDLGLIWGEFFLKKYKNRTVSYRDNGKILTDDYSSEGYEDILLQCKVDVGPSTYWSEITAMQALDNLLSTGKITLLQYLKRIPNGIIPDKEGLIKELEDQIAQQQQMELQQQTQTQKEQVLSQLTPEEQEAFTMMSPEEQEAMLAQAMGTQSPMMGGGIDGEENII